MLFHNKIPGNVKFDFQDFSIIPAIQTNIISRQDVDPYTEVESLPLFVAPMDTVVNKWNLNLFLLADLRVCLPRENENKQINFTEINKMIASARANVFNSVSLTQFQHLIYKDIVIPSNANKRFYLLVDIANGHISTLESCIKDFKKRYPKAVLMVGNIANPETFRILSKAGADYIRVGIGGGHACTTSANVAIHFPIASLIFECYRKKLNEDLETKIVADGGFKNYDDIIKALALGADYVMVGSLFNKTLEACGQAYLFNFKITNDLVEKIFTKRYLRFFKPYLTRKYRGMSTKEVQKDWNKQKLTTSEGIIKRNKIEYSILTWVENFRDYLKSAMSYSNCENLKRFKEGSEGIFISTNSFKRYHK